MFDWLSIFDVMTDFSSFSINNVECALITSGWFRRIYPPYTVVCQSQPGGNVFQCFGGRPIQADRFSIFFLLLCLDIRFPSEVCTIPCRFANSGSCLCRYSLNVSGWSPNSFGGVGYRAGVFFSGFRWLSRIWRLRFSSAFFDFRKSRPPSALPESPARSLTKSICHLCR